MREMMADKAGVRIGNSYRKHALPGFNILGQGHMSRIGGILMSHRAVQADHVQRGMHMGRQIIPCLLREPSRIIGIEEGCAVLFQ